MELAPLSATALRLARRIALTLLADRGVDSMRAFIAALEDAQRVVASTPQLGVPRPDWQRQGISLRSTRAGQFIVVYADTHRPPTIVAIFHERADVGAGMDNLGVGGDIA